MESQPLLSIVIPTKNRYYTLTNLIEGLLSWKETCFEIVVQDNSDNNTEFLKFKEKYSSDIRLCYEYDNSRLSVIDNCEKAVDKAKGEYICFIGDDDGLIPQIIQFCKWLKQNEIDSANCNCATYGWPDFKDVYFGSGRLNIERFDSKIKFLNPEKELINILLAGAQELKYGVRFYQGIISRRSLQSLKEKLDTYFPGPSPDMASAIALVPFVKKHVYINCPLIIVGGSPASTAGLGAENKHQGEIESVSFLPVNAKENWSKYLPDFWSGQTVWADSAIKALEQTNKQYLKYMNFNYVFALCITYLSKSHRHRAINKIKELRKIKELNVSFFNIYLCVIKIFFKRSISFFKRIDLKLNTNFFSIKRYAAPTIIEAIEILQKYDIKLPQEKGIEIEAF